MLPKQPSRLSLSKAVKSSWSLCFFLAAIIFLNASLALGAATQLIDVNFTTNSLYVTGGGTNLGPTMSGAALLGQAGDKWNGIDISSGTGIPLFYVNSSNSPVTMTFTSAGGYNVYSYAGTTPFKGTPYEALMENYLYSGRLGTFAPQTITLAGLAANSMYTLVLYSAADTAGAGRITWFTVNNNTLTNTWNGASSTLIAGTDYVEFASAMSDGSGNLAITWTGTNSAEGDINGFQIVANSAGPITNILANPGFEAGSFTNWSIYGPNNYIESNAGVAHGGTWFYKVFGQFNSTNNYTAIYQDNPCVPGATYSANGWAYSSSSDAINGEDEIWISVIFLDSSYNALALYQSPVISSNNIAAFGGYDRWFNLQITNQCSFTNATAFIPLPATPGGSVSSLAAPAGTAFVRYQIVFSQGPDNANGSMYFDDLALNQTGGPQAAAAPSQWNIVWDDEFNGTSINTNIWSFESGNNGGWGNNELEYYTSNAANAYVSNGLLHIAALQQSMGGQQYTSARMKTEFNFSTTYGRIVWSAALPQGTGMWPALWMLGTDFAPPGVGWPACGEIDVMEENGSISNVVQSSVHFGNSSDQDVTETALYTFPGGITATNFHTYMVDWEYGSINFYVDGNLFESQNTWSSPYAPYPAPFNAPFFLIMNLAVGGNYVGNPSPTEINSGTVFPAQMLVDYVRVYQKTVPMVLTVANQSRSQFKLSWPSNIVCHLQSRTNFLSGSWADVAGSTNPFVLSAPYSNNTVFYRLESP